MRKAFILVLAIAMLFVFAACSKGSGTAAATTTAATAAVAATPADDTNTTPSTGTVDSEYDPNKNVDFEMKTSEENRVVTIGTVDKSLYSQPVFVTSFGQSTDAAMLDTVSGSSPGRRRPER